MEMIIILIDEPKPAVPFLQQFENGQYPGMDIREARLAFDRYVARVEGRTT